MSVDYAEVARLVRLGRRAERRGKAVQGCLTVLLVKITNDLLTGWLAMLAVGVAHAEWIHALPTIGFWWAAILVTLTRGVFAAGSTASKKENGS